MHTNHHMCKNTAHSNLSLLVVLTRAAWFAPMEVNEELLKEIWKDVERTFPESR